MRKKLKILSASKSWPRIEHIHEKNLIKKPRHTVPLNSVFPHWLKGFPYFLSFLWKLVDRPRPLFKRKLQIRETFPQIGENQLKFSRDNSSH
jgi:hypothetical protein